MWRRIQILVVTAGDGDSKVCCSSPAKAPKSVHREFWRVMCEREAAMSFFGVWPFQEPSTLIRRQTWWRFGNRSTGSGFRTTKLFSRSWTLIGSLVNGCLNCRAGKPEEQRSRLAAVRAPLRRLEEQILKDHIGHCVEHAINSGNKTEQRRKIEELMAVVSRADR